MGPYRLHIKGRTFRDTDEREITIHGINVGADTKFPAKPEQPSHVSEHFYNGDDVSFVGRPFPVEDAHTHFARLRRWGYNTIRYIFTWEAIEHRGPGIYDEEWIQSTIKTLQIAKEYGFYVFMDPHQDVWSRFTGGSGAPMWTLYACGLDPRKFDVTEAALVQNTWPKPAEFPKMIWATNYTRLACQVTFTLFMGGRDFAPKCTIDGINIQDYLQQHYIGACKHLAQRIKEAGDLEGEIVIGWESWNEPHRGLISWPDLSIVGSEQKLQKGTSPTAWQAMLIGSGRACEVETWEVGGMGPYKTGTTLVDPAGVTAWLSPDHDDTKYGWKRGPDWKLGKDIWAQHGIWDPETDLLLKKDYFGKHPSTGEKIDYEYFTNHYWLEHYKAYASAIREVMPETIMFCQPPVWELPPSLKDTTDDDPNMVFAPHFYDGLTLMTKKWNRHWNVDVFGVLRGRYWSPAFAIKIGETAIRNCFRDQLIGIRKEGEDYMGVRPTVFTEIGIPYDMDEKKAYSTGDYTSQVLAMDANHYALEGCAAAGYTLWTYVASNDHYWGDQWNGEDLSIFSLDDMPLPLLTSSARASAAPLSQDSPSYSESLSSDLGPAKPDSINKTFSHADMSASASQGDYKPGYRAAEAFVRPTPVATHGDVLSFGFDLRNCVFHLSLNAPSSTKEDAPTEVFLPDYHFPQDAVKVEVSGGKWTISVDDANGGQQQMFKWWHAEGEQKVIIRGLKRRQGMTIGQDDDEGYFGYVTKLCSMM